MEFALLTIVWKTSAKTILTTTHVLRIEHRNTEIHFDIIQTNSKQLFSCKYDLYHYNKLLQYNSSRNEAKTNILFPSNHQATFKCKFRNFLKYFPVTYMITGNYLR